MKILWIAAECPFPANTGGRLGVWKRIVHLSKRNEIYLNTIIDCPEERKAEKEILKFCEEVNFFERNKITLKFLLKCFRYPFPALSRWNPKLKEKIDEECQRIKFDYIMVDFPQMAGVLSDHVRSCERIILNEHNIEHLVMGEVGRSCRNPIKKVLFLFVAKQMERFERKLVREDFVYLYTFVSRSDKDYFEKTYGKKNTYLLPVGAEIAPCEEKSDEHVLIFAGKMSYPPNVEGAKWFLKDVWGRIKAAIPDVKFYIVGKAPTAELIKLAAGYEDVVVTGEVDSVEGYYQMASLVVVPLLSGGGVKVKLLEALGHKKLVVSTDKGIEGTDLAPEKHLIMAEDPKTFADACVDALVSREKYEDIRLAGFNKVKNEYSWEVVISRFEALLNERLSGNLEDYD